jgi:hypothetical protein
MAVTVTNLVQGPGTLYAAAFGSAEPADSIVGVTADPSAPFVDVGGTDGGVDLEVAQTFSELDVDQLIDRVGSRVTKRDFSVKTSLAEPTLENWAIAMNAGTVTSSTGYKTLDPVTATSITQPIYRAIIIDAFATGVKTDGTANRRRIIVRKVLSTANVGSSYQKDKKTLLPITWTGHYVRFRRSRG